MSDKTLPQQMRSFDHDGSRWWVYGDENGAVSIHAVHVADGFRPLVSVRNPYGEGRLFPDCVTYHRPAPEGTDGAVADCPALNGRTCDPDAGGSVTYLLGQWEMLGYADQYLSDNLAELYAAEFGGAR